MSSVTAPRQRTRPAKGQQTAVWVIAVAAGLGVVTSAEPTALPVADATLCGLAALLVVYLGSRAREWSWLVLAGLATLAADGLAAAWGAGALIIALWAAATDRRSPAAGALVAGLSLQALFRLPAWEPHGVATLVALAAVGVVVVSGFRHCSGPVRRRLEIGGAVTVLVVAALTLLAVGAAMSQRSAVERGVDAAREGLRAAADGQSREAADLFSRAEDAFTDAHEVLGAPWLLPGLAVPVVGQNSQALAVAAQEGADLSATARAALTEADVEALEFDDGALDLDLVRSFQEPLARSVAELERSLAELGDADSDWLVPPVGDSYDDFTADLADASADAAVAATAVELAPALLGGEGTRRYVVLFTTPAEMRGLGGFVGNYGELTAVDGDIELTRSGPYDDLEPPEGSPGYVVTRPADYLERWGRYRPNYHLQDTTFSPDFPSVAEIWQQVYPQVPGGHEIDGVLVVDPIALAALMEFTGPITVDGYPTPLTSDNAADVLLREQYVTFGDDRGQRKDFLEDASRVTFEALTTGDLPGPRQVADVLGPMVRAGRLLLFSDHPAEQDFFVRLDLDGALPAVDGDFLSVTTQNSGNNKIDIFLHREIRYDVRYEPDSGRVEATVTIELRNDAPASGLPDVVIRNRDTDRYGVGTNLAYLTLYTPWQAVSASVDGTALGVQQAEELGRRAYGAGVQIPPGGTRVVTFELVGATEPSYDYRLTFAPQPLVNPERLVVNVAGPDGWDLCATRGLGATGDLATLDTQSSEDLTLDARFCAP